MSGEALTLFQRRIVIPGLEHLHGLGGPVVSADAVRMLLAIALQESGAKHRFQMTGVGSVGPARGFWQFERGGGVVGVMNHARTSRLARLVCDDALIDWDATSIWRALEGHDGLAVAFARLLLFTEQTPLPKTSPQGWACYLRNWRPGKPHPDQWAGHWEAAASAVAGTLEGSG